MANERGSNPCNILIVLQILVYRFGYTTFKHGQPTPLARQRMKECVRERERERERERKVAN